MRETCDTTRFFEYALDMLIISDMDGVTLAANPSFTRILGWSEEELKAMSYFDLVHPDDLASLAPVLEGLKEGKPNLSYICRSRCKDGTYRYTSWTGYPVGSLLYGVGRDVTESVEREQRLTLAFDNSPYGILLFDAGGRVTLANVKVASLLGYAGEELVGGSVLELFDGASRVAAQALMDGAQRPASSEEAGDDRVFECLTASGDVLRAEFKVDRITAGPQAMLVGTLVPIGDGPSSPVEFEEQVDGTRLIPICAGCKSVRRGRDDWLALERYLYTAVKIRFSHGLCSGCAAEMFPELEG